MPQSRGYPERKRRPQAHRFEETTSASGAAVGIKEGRVTAVIDAIKVERGTRGSWIFTRKDGEKYYTCQQRTHLYAVIIDADDRVKPIWIGRHGRSQGRGGGAAAGFKRAWHLLMPIPKTAEEARQVGRRTLGMGDLGTIGRQMLDQPGAVCA